MHDKRVLMTQFSKEREDEHKPLLGSLAVPESVRFGLSYGVEAISPLLTWRWPLLLPSLIYLLLSDVYQQTRIP